MIKPFIVLSVLATVLAQQFDIMNNLVDFDDTPYPRMGFPYRQHDYRDKRIMNVRNKLIKNAIVGNTAYEVIKRPENLLDTGVVMTSLSSLQTSLMTSISTALTTLLNGIQSTLKLLTINIPAIIFGATVTMGFCKISSFCSKFSSIRSITETLMGYSSLITPDSLNILSKFMEEAIRNYGS